MANYTDREMRRALRAGGGDPAVALALVLKRRLARLPEVPQVTAPGGLRYLEIDVAVAYEELRDDVQRLRDCLATLVDALRAPAEG